MSTRKTFRSASQYVTFGSPIGLTIASPIITGRTLLSVATAFAGLALVSLGDITSVHAQTYTDTFTQADGTTDSSFITNATFTVQNGAYVESGGSGLTFAQLVQPGYTNLTNFTVSAIDGSAGDSGLFVLGSGTATPSSGVIFLVRPSHGDIYFYNLGTSTLTNSISPSGFSSYNGSNLYLTITNSGGALTGSVYTYSSASGVGSLLATDTYTGTNLPASGDVGLYQYAPATNISHWDNFTVTNNAAAPEPASFALLAFSTFPAIGMIARRRNKAV